MIDTTAILIGLDGAEIVHGGACPTCGYGKEVQALTLKRALVDALLGNYRDETALSGTDRLKRFTLARRLTDADSIDLTSDEVSLILELAPKKWSTLVYGTIVMLLDPARLQNAWQ
jgi:hypothetical protein